MPQFRKTFDSLLEGLQIIDFTWHTVYANDAFLQSRKISLDELLGNSLLEVFPEIENTELFECLEKCMVQRTQQRHRNEFLNADGSSRWFELSIEPCEEGVVILSHDISAQQKTEGKLINITNLYAFIGQVNQSIVRVQDDNSLFTNSCKIAIEFGGFQMAWIGLFDSTSETITLAEQTGIPQSEIELFSSIDYRLNGPLLDVLNHQRLYYCNDVENEMETGSMKSFLLRHKINSTLILPLKRAGLTIGSFSLYSRQPDYSSDQEISLLLELSGDISNAIDKLLKEKEHAESEHILLLNEKHFRALIEKSSDMITLVKTDGELIYTSPSVTTVLGYSMQELLHKPDHEFIHPQDLRNFKMNIQRIIETPGSSFSNEHRVLHKDGYWIWCEGTVTNLLQQSSINAIVSNFRDVSEKKSMEQQRDFNKSNLRALINNTTDLMWSVGKDFNLITSNEPFDKMVLIMSGKSLAKGENVLNVSVNTSPSLRLRNFYERAFAGETFTEIEYTELPVEMWSEISYYPIRKDEEIVGTACHSRNITQLKKGEAFNRAVLNSLSSQIAVVDEGGNIIAINESWKRLANEHNATMLHNTGIGTNYFKVCANSAKSGDATAMAVLNGMNSVINEVKPVFYFEYPGHHQNKQHWFAMRVMRFDSREPMIVVAHEDISDRKNAEITLMHNNEQLQKTNQELDRFVYSASHDLRSPLTSIMGLLNIIELESHESNVLNYTSMIRVSIVRLDGFIKNILGYSRNNRTQLEVSEIPLNQTINDIVALLANMKDADRIKIEVNIDEKLPFYSDKQRFCVVLENIVSNAIKFQNRLIAGSHILISGKVEQDYLRLSICDNGIGIPQEYHNKIFDMFFRLPGNMAGSGIGLYIAKETVEKLGGTIEVQSSDDNDTTFVIQIRNQRRPSPIHPNSKKSA